MNEAARDNYSHFAVRVFGVLADCAYRLQELPHLQFF